MPKRPLTPLRIETISVGEFQTNCFVVGAPANRCLVVDPGSEADRILSFLKKNGLSVAAYLLTHGHVDHLAALADVSQTHPAPYYLHSADASWAFSDANEMLPFYSAPCRPPTPFRPLDGLPYVEEAGLRFAVVPTPGHSPGSVSFFLEEQGLLFSGDTLFRGSIGRTDLPGGSLRDMRATLRRISSLPPATLVYPGHGPATDIAGELRSNVFLLSPL